MKRPAKRKQPVKAPTLTALQERFQRILEDAQRLEDEVGRRDDLPPAVREQIWDTMDGLTTEVEAVRTRAMAAAASRDGRRMQAAAFEMQRLAERSEAGQESCRRALEALPVLGYESKWLGQRQSRR